MTENVLLVGHVVAPPIQIHGCAPAGYALRLITREAHGQRTYLLIARPPLATGAASARPGDLVYVEGRVLGSHLEHGSRDRSSPTLLAEDLRILSPAGVVSPTVRASGYTGIIRWQSAADPAWELETRHPGFHSPDTAALYASGLGCRSADRLLLAPSGDLHLTLTDGTAEQLEEANVQVWRREYRRVHDRPTSVHDDDGFRPLDLDPRELIHALRSQPAFTRLHFYLLSPTSQVLDASIGDGADGRPLVRITDVDRRAPAPPMAAPAFAAAR